MDKCPIVFLMTWTISDWFMMLSDKAILILTNAKLLGRYKFQSLHFFQREIEIVATDAIVVIDFDGFRHAATRGSEYNELS